MKKLILLFILFPSIAFALPNKCTFKTGESKTLCIRAKKVAVEKERREIEAQEEALAESKAPRTIIADLGTAFGFQGKEAQDEMARSKVGINTKHYISIGWGLYFLPTEPHYRKQMPASISPNEFGYNYYVNPNWSVGTLWQEYMLNGSVFEPITIDGKEKQLGSDEMRIQRLWALTTFHFDITNNIEVGLTGGLAMVYDAKYFIEGQEIAKVSPPDPSLLSLSIGYKPPERNFMASVGFRFVDSPVETETLTDYRSPGGAELYLNVMGGLF
jgi:hypothetical protein